MSHGGKLNDKVLSSSPSEDFDPLVDYGSFTPQDPEVDEHDDNDSLCNSIGPEQESIDPYRYGVTPPVNFRAMKRQKEKTRSNKFSSKSDMREIVHEIRSSRSPNRQNTAEHQILDHMLLGVAMGGDIGAQDHRETVEGKTVSGSSSATKKRPANTKSVKKTRSQERDFKRQTENANLGSSVPKSDKQGVMKNFGKTDSPNHFKSLDSKQVLVNNVQSPPLATSYIGSLQSMSMFMLQQKAPCPKERLDFLRTFHMLIRMGNRAIKDRETKAAINRQLSYEQEEWQATNSDIIWLELRAYLSRRKRSHQDDIYYRLQQKVPQILEKISKFKVRLKERPMHKSRSSQGLDVKRETVIREEPEDVAVQGVFAADMDLDGTGPSERPCDSNRTVRHRSSSSGLFEPSLSDIIQEQKTALLQVAEILQQLESAEWLYPTYKAAGQAHEIYDSQDFQSRLRSLYLWMNITMEMGNQLHLLAKMLQIGSLNIEWPWKDANPKEFLTSNTSEETIANNPKICVTHPSQAELCDEEEDEDSEEYESTDEEYDEDEEDGEEEEGEADNKLGPPKKNVHFDISDSSANSTAPATPDTELPPGGMLFPKPTDTSTPSKPSPPSRSTSLMSVSRSSSTISFEESTRTTIYREYTDRMLKRTGVTKLQLRLRDLLEGPLIRGRAALERPKQLPTYASITSIERSASDIHLSSSPSMDGLQRPPPVVQEVEDWWGSQETNLSAHGEWSPVFREMGLPSFKPTYLFLLRIPLDVIHECLRLRLEQRPKKDPSAYSIRHLIIECKEVLQAATVMENYYQKMVLGVWTDAENSDLDLDQFEDDLEKMLDVYVDYLRLYMGDLQQNTHSAMSKHLKNFLEDEWRFAKEIIPYVRGGEANAAKRFCIMGTSLLQSISNFLEAGMDDCIYQLYDTTYSIDETEARTSGTETHESESDDDEIYREARHSLAKRNSRSVEVRKGIFLTCRRLKELFNEARERVAKALNFAKMLRKDLEIAAEYNIKSSPQILLKKLQDTGHHRVLPAHSSGYAMFIPSHIVTDLAQILHLLNITCGREDLLNPDNKTHSKHKASHTENGTSRDGFQQPKEGYLVIVPYQDGASICSMWNGETLNVESGAEITIALSHTEVQSLLLVVLHSSQLAFQRKDFEQRVGGTVQIINEQISCYTAIAESIQDLKNEAVTLRDRVDDAIRKVEDKLSLEDIAEMEETEKNAIQNRYRETLLRCYNFGCEYHEELLRLVSFDMRSKLYPHLIDMAKRWMHFAVNKCEKGRGRRPKWAHVGLNFLTVAINPLSMSALPDENFQAIKTLINTCIHHVIGEKPNPFGAMNRCNSPDVTQRHAFQRIQSCPEASLPTTRNHSSRSTGVHSEPVTPHASNAPEMDGIKKVQSECVFEEPEITSPINSEADMSEQVIFPGENDLPRLHKMWEAIHSIERSRNRKLRDKKIVGRKTRKDKHVDMTSLVHVRPVKFRWQRTTKIGEGRFGKVYTAVNTNSGELMAMKEMKFQSNDIQYIKKIIDEIRSLESISGHPSLVQYFGVEVHSDEIYIFMEYCPGGTIADAAKQGLMEDMVRKYTLEILKAVHVLHEHGIIHRDIKGPNIFLTENGLLKLGDLGCAVQLKSQTTMPGEVKGMEGTAAYMAPEVFTNHEGGRASDIWSFGCTVIEMATGKRPWPELENQFQIMYKVGMGESPTIPTQLSDEGQDFVKHCLEHDPKLRWDSSDLQGHSFVKIYELDTDEASGDDA